MSKLANFIRKVKATSCSAVVVAAGSSTRMGEDKLFMELEGKPVLARTLLALNACACVDEIVLVVRPDMLSPAAKLCRDYGILKCAKVVCGGETRSQSALSGLSEIRRGARIAIVHDGARPLVTEGIIRDVVHMTALHKCAAPAIPVTDTVKLAQDGEVDRTLQRDKLFAVQTPQGFVPELIKAALTVAVRDGKEYTDDCAAAEAMGIRVRLTEGSPENIKITRPLDMQTAAAIVKSRGL